MLCGTASSTTANHSQSKCLNCFISIGVYLFACDYVFATPKISEFNNLNIIIYLGGAKIQLTLQINKKSLIYFKKCSIAMSPKATNTFFTSIKKVGSMKNPSNPRDMNILSIFVYLLCSINTATRFQSFSSKSSSVTPRPL